MAGIEEPFPEGVVTFVFTDIEGSTRLFHRIGDGYLDLLDRHHRILRDAWADHHGREVKTEGDAFFVAFAEASDAVMACAEAQRALEAEAWMPEARVRVRMGMHTGLAYPRDRDYVAFAVHQAARVVNAAHGGQIIVSSATVARLGDTPMALTLQSLGRFRVRDFDDPVELFQVGGEGLPHEFAALRVLPADHHNLVAPSTTLVGRDADVTELGRLVGAARLVTVLGPGGLGKTRLVTEYGLAVADQWADGVWLVDLAAIDNPALIPQSVASALGVSTGADVEAWSALLDHLAERRLLLLIDNCEHLLSGVAARVDELLRRCSSVKVLATSREPLGLRSERVWRLPVLSSDGPAVELFLDRTGLRDRSGEVRFDVRASVVTLCRMLDGLPLAIELAAARVDVMSPAEMVERLGQRTSMLRSKDPTLANRQRSLDDLIDWSVQLLSADERTAFTCLGVFATGFTLETAAIALADGAIDPYDVPELIWSLVSKSLLISEPAAGETRYRMLETMRADARRRLRESNQLSVVASRVARSFATRFAQRSIQSVSEIREQRFAEIDNIRALIPIVGLAECDLAQSLAMAVLACSGVGSFSYRDGVIEVGAFARSFDAATPERISLLAFLGDCAANTGMMEQAEAFLDEADRLRHDVVEPESDELCVAYSRGVLLIVRREAEKVRSLAVQGLASARTPFGRSRMYCLLGLAEGELGSLEAAHAAIEKSLELDIEREAWGTVAMDQGNLAETSMRLGDWATAARHQSASFELALQQGVETSIAFSMVLSARLLEPTSDWLTLVRLHGHADALLERIGQTMYPSDQAISAELLGRARSHLGGEAFESAYRSGVEAEITAMIDVTRAVLQAVADRPQTA